MPETCFRFLDRGASASCVLGHAQLACSGTGCVMSQDIEDTVLIAAAGSTMLAKDCKSFGKATFT
jgi:hypothetical protein